jgi:hypothetical protein
LRLDSAREGLARLHERREITEHGRRHIPANPCMSGQVEKTLMLLSYHPDANKVLDDFSVKATLVLITGDLPAGKTKMKIRSLKVVN